MTDIIIYTTPEKLLHKQGKLENDPDYSEDGEYYWSFSHMPKGLEEGKSKIYFATKSFIRGYFIIEEVHADEIILYCRTWKDIKPIPITHFQGFKYADKVKELKGD